MFQFTHPRGVRHKPKLTFHFAQFGFNSRTREGCDVPHLRRFFLLPKFQFTHPRGVRHPVYRLATGLDEFQFTHPRGVRLIDKRRPNKFTYVSIHAPARGATFLVLKKAKCEAGFNSRTREGCDEIIALVFELLYVSIHAPARGATVLGFIYLFLRSYNAFFAKYYIVSCFCVYYAYFLLASY